jgi:hypothetical protein
LLKDSIPGREHSQRLNTLLKNSTRRISGAEALTGQKDLIAALEALRHLKASFLANC